jgi:hypothetical protein
MPRSIRITLTGRNPRPEKRRARHSSGCETRCVSGTRRCDDSGGDDKDHSRG